MWWGPLTNQNHAQRCMEGCTEVHGWVCAGVQGVHRGPQRGVWRSMYECTQVCRGVCRDMQRGVQRCTEVHGGVSLQLIRLCGWV